jgi:hypothetical protein
MYQPNIDKTTEHNMITTENIDVSAEHKDKTTKHNMITTENIDVSAEHKDKTT